MEDKFLFVEKYRPKTIAECILPEATKKQFEGIIAQGRIPNLLLAGSPGTGKTTAARALCEQVGADYILINASNENGVDTFRTKVTQFATSVSLTDAKKVIILDECLEENEEVRIGTVDDWKPVKLKDLQRGVKYPVVSFNMETGEYENDVGEIISDKFDEVFEVELEDGRKIYVTSNHPFIVNDNGKFCELSISSGQLLGADVVVV